MYLVQWWGLNANANAKRKCLRCALLRYEANAKRNFAFHLMNVELGGVDGER